MLKDVETVFSFGTYNESVADIIIIAAAHALHLNLHLLERARWECVSPSPKM